MGDDDEMKKYMMQAASKINQNVKEIESFQMPTIPWDEYDRELTAKGMPGFVEAVKPKWEAFDAEYRSKLTAAKDKFVAEAEVEMKKVFEGPSGVIAQFKQMEKEVQDSKVKFSLSLRACPQTWRTSII